MEWWWVATALILVSAALHHGVHALERLLPSVGLDASLASARGMVDRLLAEVESTNPPTPERFARREPSRSRRA
ncbi:MAG: hypothetical protein M3353_00335 [Actinomycetota bacterium]|nr:hypothetical protein [Actinomycetota bacterium]